MTKEDWNILTGEDGTLEIPPYTAGEFIYQELIKRPPQEIRMIETESGKSITNEEFKVLLVKTAEALKEMGIQRGDVVAITGEQSIDISAALCATLLAGGTISLIEPTLVSNEMEDALKLIRPKVIFCDNDLSETMSQMIGKLDYDVIVILLLAQEKKSCRFTKFEDFIKKNVDVASFRPTQSENTSKSMGAILFSSGTTGPPKPVMASDKCLVYRIITVRESFSKFGFSILLPCRIFWLTGFVGLLIIVSGAMKGYIMREMTPRKTLIAIDKFKPEFALLSTYQLISTSNDPNFYQYDVSAVKGIVTGGAFLYKSTYSRIKRKWPAHVRIVNIYGASETLRSLLDMRLGINEEPSGSILPDVKMKVVNESGKSCGAGELGELLFMSREMLSEYYQSEELTRKGFDKDGYFRSGDIGYYTKDGSVCVIGRKKDTFKVGNHVISPAEIEDVIWCMEGVVDVGVTFIQIDLHRSHILALVMKVEGSKITTRDIMDYANENLEKYKWLNGVRFVDALPRTPSGKMKRAILNAMEEALYNKESVIT